MAEPTHHPSPRTDTLLLNQLLKLVTDTLEKALPFILQKMVSHQGKGVAPKTAPLPQAHANRNPLFSSL